jgi:hypothetical protein
VNQLRRVLDEALQSGLEAEEADSILRLEGCPEELLEAAWEARRRRSGEIRFYYPLPRFPSISVTGYRCSLNCEHCRGKYLRQMKPVETPEELRKLCERLDKEGATGCLVSGGSTPQGSVPLEGFYDALRWVKQETGLIINVHTGLVDRNQAEQIAATGVDVASLDLIGSGETIRRVTGLSKHPEDYLESLLLLREEGVPSVVPHICVGLDWGTIKGEANALGLLKGFNPELIVILGLRPTRGTPMESAPAPKAETIAKVVAVAGLMYPKTSIALGCMRPWQGRAKADVLMFMAGADRIVLPSAETVKLAEERGLRLIQLDACCAVPTRLEGKTLRGSVEEPSAR